ncbi:MAG TPA: helix-turn-helix transcriptional regulator [Chitinophaga sp.]|uniref:helix-turn-helix domain-containing protein n=1 Tax=Chitinophaga sp. TaxID=1869181 RepID=UPI002CB558D2|nr:helix-turn-helix transcriptional regulator [Chitinophaga sp.]HVI49321.1 helix-turn-helix transcriptional regulator [Chitinophaga sp.]
MAIIDADKVLSDFGEILLSHRKKANLSQRQLAAKCDTEVADIGRYERGEINPTLITIIDIARGLDIAPYLLLHGLK